MMTIFQKIIDGELPCKKIYETETVLAFEDLNPQAPIHILIIPKLAVSSVHFLEDEKIWMDLLTACQRVARLLDVEDSYRIVSNHGAQAGQSVFHLHLHLLAGAPLVTHCGTLSSS